MALTGHLSDLSLSELIEFFCNQRKSGRLKVLYPKGAGYFYLQAGSVVDARIGVLHGIDAVYYALTLPNAEFQFSVDVEAKSRTINQPWTQVVLEGLRRLDENIAPSVAFPQEYVPEPDEFEDKAVEVETASDGQRSFAPAFLAFGKETATRRKPLLIGAIAVAILASVAVIGVPAGWYSGKKAARLRPRRARSQTRHHNRNQQALRRHRRLKTRRQQPNGCVKKSAKLAKRRTRKMIRLLQRRLEMLSRARRELL
jgi:hypothetical protein